MGLRLGQKRDGLDVVGLGEHIHGLDFGDPVASADQDIEVAGEGRRVAGYVGHSVGGEFKEGIERLGVASGSGRVEDNGVGRGVEVAYLHEVAQGFLGLHLDELDVVQALGVGSAVLDGGGGLLDGYGAGDVGGEQDGEDSDAGVGVNQRVRRV